MFAPSPDEAELADLIRGYLRNRGLRDWITTVALIVLTCWCVVCESRSQTDYHFLLEQLAKKEADIADLRRLLSMQMTDPKYWGRINAQHQAIREYDKKHGRSLNGTTDSKSVD